MDAELYEKCKAALNAIAEKMNEGDLALPFCMPKIILAGLGGSHAYGTNVPGSDIDIRGVYLNTPAELLGIARDKEQVVMSEPDAVIYSLKKFAKLAADGNPNIIEMLGLRPCDYIRSTKYGDILLENRHKFLSKKIIHTFGGYARSQLNRLVNKRGRRKDELVEMEHRSLQNVMGDFYVRQKDIMVDDFSAELNENGEIICNMTFRGVPMDRLIGMTNELINVDKNYRNSARNNKAEAHGKIAKHMMHLIRLYIMGADILNTGEIFTYREEEHDLLMAIRNGEYLESDGCTPTKKFEQILDFYSREFEIAAENTLLPDEPDWNGINHLLVQINKEIVNED